MSTALLNLLFAQTIYKQARENDADDAKNGLSKGIPRPLNTSPPTHELFIKLADDLKKHPLNSEFNLSPEACKSLYSALLPSNPSRPTESMLKPLVAKLYESYKRDIVSQIRQDEAEYKLKLQQVEQIEEGKWDAELMKEIQDLDQAQDKQKVSTASRSDAQPREPAGSDSLKTKTRADDEVKKPDAESDDEEEDDEDEDEEDEEDDEDEEEEEEGEDEEDTEASKQSETNQASKGTAAKKEQVSVDKAAEVEDRTTGKKPDSKEQEAEEEEEKEEGEPKVTTTQSKSETSASKEKEKEVEEEDEKSSAEVVGKDDKDDKDHEDNEDDEDNNEDDEKVTGSKKAENGTENEKGDDAMEVDEEQDEEEESDAKKVKKEEDEEEEAGEEEEAEDEDDEEDEDESKTKRGRKRKRQASPSPSTSAPSTKKFQTVVGPLLANISSNKSASFFKTPVNTNDAPNYSELIYSPTDLRTIKQSVKDGSISSTIELERELEKMFANAVMYNPWTSDMSRWAREMQLETESYIAMFRAVERTGRSASGTPKDSDNGSEPPPEPSKRRKK